MTRIFLSMALASSLAICSAPADAEDSPDQNMSHEAKLDMQAQMASCAATFKLGATVAPDDKTKQTLATRQFALEKSLVSELRGIAKPVMDEAWQVLIQRMKEARTQDEESGAQQYLVGALKLCFQRFP